MPNRHYFRCIFAQTHLRSAGRPWDFEAISERQSMKLFLVDRLIIPWAAFV